MASSIASVRLARAEAPVRSAGEAAKKTDVASLIVSCLERAKVRYVFGIPGKAIHPLLRALAYRESSPDGIRFIMGRHEGACAFMADGYARVTGGVGVCLTSSGPGATNAVTGVLCAESDHSALLLITGECPRTDFGRAAFQCGADPGSDILALYRTVTARSHRLERPEEVVNELVECLALAHGSPRRAVHLSVPTDVSASGIDVEPDGRIERIFERRAAKGIPEWQLDGALDALLRARRPLILLGSGAAEALSCGGLGAGAKSPLFAEFERSLVSRHSIPLMTTPKAKGIFPERHALSLGSYGMAGSEWALRYLRQHELWPENPAFDCLVVIGSGMKQWATLAYHRQLLPRGPAFQIDHNRAALGRAFSEIVGIEGDAELALAALARKAAARERADGADERAAFVRDVIKAVPSWLAPEARTSSAVPLFPERVLGELQQVLDRADADGHPVNLFLDIGNTTGWCWHCLELGPPHRLFSNTAMGSMGWSIGAAIGGKLADPARHVLAVVGDGAFLMNGSEISTAAHYGVPVTWLVFQDDNMAMVTQGMTATHAEPPGTSFGDCYALGGADLVAFAKSLGADALAIDAPGELALLLPGVMQAAETRRRPQVLIVRVDPTRKPPFPHLRPELRATREG